MIVACPSCSARFRMPDEAAGRKVRCGSCAHVWRPEADPAQAPREPKAEREDALAIPSEPEAAERALDPAEQAALQAAVERERLRAKAERALKPRRLWPARALGAGLAAAGVIGAAYGFEDRLAGLWPKSQDAYIALGLRSAPEPLLAIEDLALAPETDGAVRLSGTVRRSDPSDVDMTALPPLEARLLAADGSVLFREAIPWRDRPARAAMFSLVITQTPPGAAAVEVAPAAAGDGPAPR